MRSVKYGETSLVVTVFTERFGLQSYMVSGVRKSSAKGANPAAMYQPGALLEMVVYHHGERNLQRIREASWGYVYRQMYDDVRKNAVSLFMVELLLKCLRQPEPQEDLFLFAEDALHFLDQASPMATANFPLYFALHLSHFFGFRLQDNFNAATPILDLREGEFVSLPPLHPDWSGPELGSQVSHFLKAIHPESLAELPLNRDQRRKLMELVVLFYRLHSAEFGELRSLPVLQAILD